MFGGDFETARPRAWPRRSLKQVTGTRRASYGDLFLAAFEGLPERALPLITATTDEAPRPRGGAWAGTSPTAPQPSSTSVSGGTPRRPRRPPVRPRATSAPSTPRRLPDLVEAAVPQRSAGAGRGRAAPAAGRDRRLRLGLGGRGRGPVPALLSEGAEAETAYDEALTRLARTRLRVEHARTHLLYGEWLRREGRRGDAREQLRAAHETFAELGIEAFAERARRELLATGEKVRKREVDTLNQLTPQEEHIARLARDGRSNPEIAAELFISARTVEWHLRKVFGKLGIRSRRELREVLPGHGRSP